MRLAAFVAGAGIIGPVATAQEDPVAPAVDELRIVVLEARGSRKARPKSLTAGIKRAMRGKVDSIASSRQIRKARKKLRISKKRRYRKKNLRRLGRALKADYVLYTRIKKKRRTYTARAKLLHVATGEWRMDFRSSYRSPRRHAKDRGRRIGKKTVWKLGVLHQVPQEGDEAGAGTAPVATGVVTTTDAPDETTAELTPAAGEAEVDDAPADAPVEGAIDLEPTITHTTEAETTVIPLAPEESATFEVEVVPEPVAVGTRLRLRLGAGAQLVRNYSLTNRLANGDARAVSGLSYRVYAGPGISFGLNWLLPGVPLEIDATGRYRLIRFSVDLQGQVTTPTGYFFDGELKLGYRLALSGERPSGSDILDQDSLQLQLGARWGASGLNSQVERIVILGYQSQALLLGATTNLHFGPVELLLGAEGGLILRYAETPDASGDSPSGFTLGGFGGLRYWFGHLGISLDAHLQNDRVQFSGLAGRTAYEGEEGRIDYGLNNFDFVTTLGVALRL